MADASVADLVRMAHHYQRDRAKSGDWAYLLVRG